MKTFGRLLIVFVPLWVTMFSISMHGIFEVSQMPLEFQELPNSTCVYSLFSRFTYSPWWCGMITLLLYKFIVYPVIRRIIGSIMRQMTVFIFLVMFLNIAYSTFSIVVFVQYDGYISSWSQFVYTILSSSAFTLLVPSNRVYMCSVTIQHERTTVRLRFPHFGCSAFLAT